MMKLTFIGCGSAFSLKNLHSNMLLESTLPGLPPTVADLDRKIEVLRTKKDEAVKNAEYEEAASYRDKAEELRKRKDDIVRTRIPAEIAQTTRRMLIDCGATAQQALHELGYNAFDIDDLYVSHQHADHVGGMEWLGFSRYFGQQKKPMPDLYINEKLATSLWNETLRGGMSSHQGVLLELDSFFEKVHRIRKNGSFKWGGGTFQPIQTVHVMNGYEIIPSYGLLIKTDGEDSKEVFITTDTQFCPRQIEDFYKRASIIFQDCEAAPYKSGVHAHYDDLRTLPDDTKAKMWLYHYPDTATDPKSEHCFLERMQQDGFAGFVQKGQSFEF